MKRFISFKIMQGKLIVRDIIKHLFISSYHKTEEVVDKMKELNIEPVWNVPYHCAFNDAVEK